MKTYVTFVAFTLGLAGVFVVAYLSSSMIDVTTPFIKSLYELPFGIPSPNTFMLIWGIVYGFSVILITATIATRCLRRGAKMWALLGVLNTLFCFIYFKLGLYYLGIGIIITMLATLGVLLNFYIKNTRYLYLCMIPILAAYGYALILSILVCIH